MTNNQHEQLSVVKAKDIIEEVLASCAQRFTDYQISLTFKTYKSEMKIECSPKQVSRKLLENLNRSIKLVCEQKDKWIEIEMGQYKDQCCLSIRDSRSRKEENKIELLFPIAKKTEREPNK